MLVTYFSFSILFFSYFQKPILWNFEVYTALKIVYVVTVSVPSVVILCHHIGNYTPKWSEPKSDSRKRVDGNKKFAPKCKQRQHSSSSKILDIAYI